MTLRFIRRHHLLTALVLLSLAAVLYVIGLGVSAMILVLVALGLELTGWILLFTGPPDRESDL